MDARERRQVITAVQDDLANVIGASGNPEELVRLTTSIVQGAKKILVGVPEELSTKSTSILSKFVVSARSIAKNPIAVDAKGVQELSSCRRAVELLVNELETWHSSHGSDGDHEGVLRSFSSDTKTPDPLPLSEKEQRLVRELKKLQSTIRRKKNPQTSPPNQSDVVQALDTSLKGVNRASTELIQACEARTSAKEQLLEPLILMCKMVSTLLDIVDSLFVSKYPMRSQVYSFTDALMDAVLQFGSSSKSEDLATVKDISTQCPALLQAVEVMVEQCHKRVESLEESRDFSIRRNDELRQIDHGMVKQNGAPLTAKRRKKPPQPPREKPKLEFEIFCMVCTNVAVDQKTQQPISRGSELSLMISNGSTVSDVKQDLASRTGLLLENIQFNQGQEELPDSTVINPTSALPYFLFNKYEPTEFELREIRKDQRRKQTHLTIESMDWSQVNGPVAIALYECDTLGDDKNLAFDEGEIIEIMEKSADGWWEGRIGDRVGSFPASFVEEIKSKEEGLQLMRLMKKGSQSRSAAEESASLQVPNALSRTLSEQPSSASSPKPQGKGRWRLSRGVSNPEIVDPSSKPDESIKTKRAPSLFNKKKKRVGPANIPLMEEDEDDQPPPRSPVLVSGLKTKLEPKPEPQPELRPEPKHELKVDSTQLVRPRRSSGGGSSPKTDRGPKPKIPMRPPRVLGQKECHAPEPPAGTQEAPSATAAPTTDRAPSPQMNYKRSSGVGQPGKKRPPPPRPLPFAKTHPTQASKLTAIIHSRTSGSFEETDEEKTGETQEESKGSDSVEDLFKDLQEFQVADIQSQMSFSSQMEAEFETFQSVEPSPVMAPSPDDEVVTIKVSEYKPDSSSEEEKDEEDGEVEIGIFGARDTADGSSLSGSSPLSQRQGSVDSGAGRGISPMSLKQESFDSNIRGASPLSQRQESFDSIARGVSPYLPEASSPVFTPGSGSPLLAVKNDRSVVEHKRSPPPIAPPRQRRRPGGASPLPSRAPPPPPSRVRTSQSEINLRSSASINSGGPGSPYLAGSVMSGLEKTRAVEDERESSPIRARRLTVKKEREQLLSGPPKRCRSPVVQRRTQAVMGYDSPQLRSAGRKKLQCTGIGKQGILHKEGSKTSDWKSRFFRLVEDGLLYYETEVPADKEMSPIGEISVKKMEKVIEVGEREDFVCFAILMKYDTTVMFGCHTRTELLDWIKSINLLIDTTRIESKPQAYLPSHKAAVGCIRYLLESPTPLDKMAFKLSCDMGQVKNWLKMIDEGQEINVSQLSDISSTLYLLRSLFTEDRFGYVVPNDVAKDISQHVKKSCPVKELQSKLLHLPDESLQLLRLFLKLFSKVLHSSQNAGKHKLEASDFNRMFGSVLFENLKSNHSLTLIAYLISTHEMMFT